MDGEKGLKRQKVYGEDRFYIGDGRLQRLMELILADFPSVLIDLISLYEVDCLTSYSCKLMHIYNPPRICTKLDCFQDFVEHIIAITQTTAKELAEWGCRGSIYMIIDEDHDKNLMVNYTFPLSRTDLAKHLRSDQRLDLLKFLKNNPSVNESAASLLFAEYEVGKDREYDFGPLDSYAQSTNPHNPFPCEHKRKKKTKKNKAK